MLYNGAGELLYTLALDTEEYVTRFPRMALDSKILCVADTRKVVMWESLTGKLVRTIPLPGYWKENKQWPKELWNSNIYL